MIILCIISLILSIGVLAYGIHMAVIFQRFNDSVKSWSESLDNSMREALGVAARNLLREFDKKITETNLNNLEDEERVEDED